MPPSPSTVSLTSVVAPATPRIVALVWAKDRPRVWLETVQTLLMSQDIEAIRVGVPSPGDLAGLRDLASRVSAFVIEDFPKALESLLKEGFDQILVVTKPVSAPLDMLARASVWMARDARLATVSFISNDAGLLSFPHRNTPTPMGVGGHDENTLTTLVRSRRPDTGAVPIAMPDGAAILVSALLLAHSGGAASETASDPQLSLVNLAVSAASEGFVNCVDACTYVTSPWEWNTTHPQGVLNPDQINRLGRLNARFPAQYAADRDSLVAPVAQALDLARAKAQGLRVLMDGSCLGPQEMGTQLLVMALTKALLKRKDVNTVYLATPDPNNLPAYVQDVRALSKLVLVRSDDLRFTDAPHVDIIHRPYQPDRPIPWARWRDLGKRSLITIQDLIAYRNGSYFSNWDDWRRYRTNLAEQVAQADGVVSISHDVVTSVREERLQIADNRLFVVENGIDYRHADGLKSAPAAVLARGWEAAPFLFILGANYTHKNRDLAVRIWRGLCRRGHDLKLILAGANVPRGSTRHEEAALLLDEPHVLKLPDVSGPERDWLMSRTALVLYPTSAEGFGQLPFEAARFGKPALYVAFGPLAELIDDDGAPRTWDLDGLVDRAEALLTDPALAQQATRRAMGKLDQLGWDSTAAKSVEAYFDLLGRIPNPG